MYIQSLLDVTSIIQQKSVVNYWIVNDPETRSGAKFTPTALCNRSSLEKNSMYAEKIIDNPDAYVKMDRRESVDADRAYLAE